MLKLTSYTPPCVFPQLVSEAVLPLSPPLSASLLSEHVEREQDEGGQERFRVRTLFHKRGDTSNQRTCVTLHAFKETEEYKASCITQVRTRYSLSLASSSVVHFTFFSSYLLLYLHPSICPVSQPPLGLCVATLILPSDWFKDQHANRSHQDFNKSHSNSHAHNRVQRREWQRGRRHRRNHQRETSPSLR